MAVTVIFRDAARAERKYDRAFTTAVEPNSGTLYVNEEAGKPVAGFCLSEVMGWEYSE